MPGKFSLCVGEPERQERQQALERAADRPDHGSSRDSGDSAGALSVWAYRGRPVYTCSLDRQPGDANCDSFGEFNGRRNGYRAFWLRDDFGNSAYSL